MAPSSLKGSLTWQTPAVMLFNFLSAVGIIFINKIVFKKYKFTAATFITGCHFATTFFCLILCSKLKLFVVKSVNIYKIIPICLSFCGFVVFNNLSLQYNSVGFYQLMKVMTTPVIVIIQYLIYKIKINVILLFPLLLVIIGIVIVTCNEVELNIYGFIYSILGILSTSFYQIFVKTKQQDLLLNSFQLLYYQSSISGVFVFMITPVFDNINDIINYSYDINIIFFILLSCLLAFCVNLSIFLTIGRTSPISYNVLGHFKLCFVTIGGIIFFKESANRNKIFGVVLALTGIMWYTWKKLFMENEWEKRGQQIKNKIINEKNFDDKV